MPARFRCEGTFVLASRSLFILGGTILEGVVRIGMKVLIPWNRHTSTPMIVDAVEFMDPGGKIVLCVKYKNQEELDLMQAFNIGDEELELID